MYSKTYLYPDMKRSLYMVENLSDGLDQENEVTVMTLLRVMDVVPFDKWPFQKRIRLVLCSNGKKRKCDFAKRWTDTIKKGLKSCVYLSFLFCQIPSVRDRGGREGTKENENVWFLALSVLRDYQVCGWGLRLLAVEYFVMDFLSLSKGWLINWVLFSHPMMHCPITNQSSQRVRKILTDKVTMKDDSAQSDMLRYCRYTG